MKAQEVLQTNLANDRSKVMEEMLQQEDLGIIKMRIQDNIKVLTQFNELRDPEKTRAEYVDEL